MIDHIIRCGAAVSLAAAAMLTVSAGAAMADGSDVLAAYQGDWRGRGEARPNPQSKPTRVSC